MRLITINETNHVAGGDLLIAGGFVATAIGGFIAGSSHMDFFQTIIIGGVAVGAAASVASAYAMLPAAGLGLVSTCVAYTMGANYFSSYPHHEPVVVRSR